MPIRFFLFLLLLITHTSILFAQIDTMSEKTLSEVLISANKFKEQKRNIAQKFEILTAKTIAKNNSQNTGDLLMNSGNVFVQKSQQGGGSPVLRGFEGNQVLLVIDGVRMNNAIYRAGHLQNIVTVDQNMLERVEILSGPGSTLYGSDALGGVIYLRTKSPILSNSKKIKSSGNFFSRYSSVNNEKSLHFNLSIGGKKIAWLQAYTFSDFDDLKIGKNDYEQYPEFGKRKFYIEYLNGLDTILKNPDDRIQLFSGYKQWDMTQKFLSKQNEAISHSLNFQFSNSSNIPRYDRLQDVRNGNLRFAEWSYGPQKRMLSSYEMNINSAGFFNQLRANINYQFIEESRLQRDYRRYDRADKRIEQLQVLGIIFDARKKWDNNELTIGADAQLNSLASIATRTNLLTNTISKLDTRYFDGKNKMNYFGLFGQHFLKHKNGKWILNDGIRLQATTLSSFIIDNSFFNFPFSSIKQNNFTLTGNIGAVYLPDEFSRAVVSFASGFRSPNLDDLSKTFEPNTSQKRIIIPNQKVNPEFTYSLDFGLEKTFYKKIKIELTSFYTIFKNAIGVAPFQLNGQDSIFYNGTNIAIYANRNVKNAHMFGYNGNLKIDFTNQFSFLGILTYTYGMFKNSDGRKYPQDHIPPVFGRTILKYSTSKIETEISSLFNGWKRLKDYNPDGEDNLQYATEDGTPSWIILSWKNNFSINKNITLQFAIENILDKNYRYFASGISAPGRNFVFALRGTF